MLDVRHYVVRQGDFLMRIAFRKGFSAMDVCNHLSNEALCAAITAFQEARGVSVSSAVDGETRDALVRAYSS
jgi:hypothetical protein